MRPENQGGPGSREPCMLGLDMVQTWWEVMGRFKAGPARNRESWELERAFWQLGDNGFTGERGGDIGN